MKSIQSILYFLIFIINITTINAQSTNIYLILDRENYGTGEVANGVLVIDGVKIHNKALHIEVRNAQTGNLVHNTSSKIYNNQSSFYIPLSSELPSGTYTIDTYVCTIENVTNRNIVDLASTTINLINLRETKLSKETFFEVVKESKLSGDNAGFKVSSFYDKVNETYKVRFSSPRMDSIKFIAATSDRNLNIQHTRRNWAQSFAQSFSEKLFYVLYMSDDKGQKQFGLVGLYSPVSEKLFISKSDSEGKAIFILDDYEGVHGFNLFVYQNNSVKPVFPDKKSSLTLSGLSEISWDKMQKDATLIRKRDNIHQYFEVVTFGLRNPILMKKNDVPKPYSSFNPTTYKKFPDLQTFCKENALELRFRTDKSNTVATLSPPPRFTNTYEKIEWTNPFFIVDGKPETDYKKISDMKPEQITSMQIFYDKKEIIPWVYAFGTNGIITIDTKNKNNVTPQMKINGFQNQFTEHQTIISEAKLSGKPALIQTLLWKNIEHGQNPMEVELKDSSVKFPKNIFVVYSAQGKFNFTSAELSEK